MQEKRKKINDILNGTSISIFIASIFSLIFFLIIYKNNGIMYATNDDIAMRSIASGIYLGGEKSSQMIFAGFPFNIIVTFLYRLTNKLDWYGIILISLTIFYFVYTIFSIIKQKDNIAQKIVYTCSIILLTSILFSTFLVNITFTVVSAFIATCCLVLYCLPSDKIKNIIMSIGIIISFGIRSKACLMVLVFFLPIFLYKNNDNKENLKSDFILGIKIGISLIMCITFQKLMMSNIEWREYLSYNENRSLFYDYYYDSIISLPEEEKEEIFVNAGFSDEEIKIVCSNGAIGFLDNIPDRMFRLIEQCEKHNIKMNSDFKSSYIQLMKDTKLAKFYLITLLIFLYHVIKSKDRKKKIPIFLMFLLLQFGILSYLVYQGRLIDRVVIPLFASFIVMNIVMLLGEEEPKRIIEKILNYDKIFAIIASIILYMFSITNIKVDLSTREFAYTTNEILEYFAQNSENFYIYDRNSLENFNIKNKYLANNYLNMSGWSAFLPLHKRKINKYDANTLKELLFRDNTYLAIPYSYDSNNEKYRFLFENVSAELVDEVNGIYIYKLKNE